MAMSVGGKSSVKAEPNVTPMIDVMLVLLIIFMIIVPSITAGFQATPPSGQNLKPKPENDQDQILGIDVNGNYFLNRNAIPKEQLGPELNKIFRDREEKVLYVKADRGLAYEKILDVMDVAGHNNVANTAMITEQIPGTSSKISTDNLQSVGAGTDGGM